MARISTQISKYDSQGNYKKTHLNDWGILVVLQIEELGERDRGKTGECDE